MPVKLSTTLEKIDKIENIQNRFLVKQYHKFMDSTGASERHQNNNVKVLHHHVNYLGKNIFFTFIKSCDSNISFLETQRKKPRMKTLMENDLTWNHYLQIIKHFFRWYGIIIVFLTHYYKQI